MFTPSSYLMKCPMINGAISKSAKKRIIILGGGFGGVYAALHLEKLLTGAPEIEICLVSRDNFFLQSSPQAAPPRQSLCR